MRVPVWILAAVLAACQPPDEAAVHESAALGARSGHAFSVRTETGDVQEVLLAGVLAPRAPDAADAARGALDALLTEAGSGLELVESEAGQDRYGRPIVYPRFRRGADTVWLDAVLVEAGHVLAWPRIGSEDRVSALLALEAAARANGRGAWGGGGLAVVGPDPNGLAQALDGPVLVEGRVIAVGEARDGRVFLNFGLDWRTDFTAVVARRDRDRFEAHGVELQALEGAVVRVRGWLYEQNGPAIRMASPYQLELVDAPQQRPLR